MVFRDGELADRECPKCGQPLFYEMSFFDCFSPINGHYTRDAPLVVCCGCNYQEDYEGDESYED